MNTNVGYLGVALVVVGAMLLAPPTLGFETIAADRGTQVETAADADALIGFEPTTETIAGRQDTATAFYLRNNGDQQLTLSTDTALSTTDVAIANDGSGTIAPGDATQVVLECNGGGTTGTVTVTTTVNATGSSLSVQGASSSTTVDYDCTGGGGGSNKGFNSVSVGDVTANTTPGDERQTVTFEPAHNLDNSNVTIDLSAAHPDGVNYSETGFRSDVQVVQGNGDVVSVSSDGVITYQAGSGGNKDKKGSTIELSVGNYSTTTAAGPFTATFTREDNGDTASTSFEVVDDN